MESWELLGTSAARQANIAGEWVEVGEAVPSFEDEVCRIGLPGRVLRMRGYGRHQTCLDRRICCYWGWVGLGCWSHHMQVASRNCSGWGLYWGPATQDRFEVVMMLGVVD